MLFQVENVNKPSKWEISFAIKCHFSNFWYDVKNKVTKLEELLNVYRCLEITEPGIKHQIHKVNVYPAGTLIRLRAEEYCPRCIHSCPEVAETRD